jgi:hypothetical protein
MHLFFLFFLNLKNCGGGGCQFQNSRRTPSGRKVTKAEREKQAGAELCQAQVQLELAMLAVTRKKLMPYLLQILGHIPFQKKFMLSSSKY